VKRYINALALPVLLVTIGAAIGKCPGETRLTRQQSVQSTSTLSTADMGIDFAHEPLWAYGFDTRT
jgi:hypothetical protein